MRGGAPSHLRLDSQQLSRCLACPGALRRRLLNEGMLKQVHQSLQRQRSLFKSGEVGVGVVSCSSARFPERGRSMEQSPGGRAQNVRTKQTPTAASRWGSRIVHTLGKPGWSCGFVSEKTGAERWVGVRCLGNPGARGTPGKGKICVGHTFSQHVGLCNTRI